MASINTYEFVKLVDPGIQKYFGDPYKPLARAMQLLFKEEEAESQSEVEQSYTGVKKMRVVGESELYPSSKPYPKYGTTYTQVKYGDTIQVTWEMARFGRDKEVYDAAKLQRREVIRTIEDSAANVFRHAFNSSYTSYQDGKPLCATDHPRADGGTAQSNKSSTNIALSYSNLTTAKILGEEVLEDNGETFQMYLDTLIVPNTLLATAQAIVGSEKKPGSNDNDINVVNPKNRINVQIYGATNHVDYLIVWKLLSSYAGGSDTAWFLMDSALKPLIWKWGAKPEIAKPSNYEKGGAGYENDTAIYKVRMMYAYGWRDWRGIWGSAGA